MHRFFWDMFPAIVVIVFALIASMYFIIEGKRLDHKREKERNKKS